MGGERVNSKEFEITKEQYESLNWLIKEGWKWVQRDKFWGLWCCYKDFPEPFRYAKEFLVVNGKTFNFLKNTDKCIQLQSIVENCNVEENKED